MIQLAAMTAAAFCTPTATDAQPAAVVDSFLAAYNSRDFDGMRRAMTADAVIRRYPQEQVQTGSSLMDAYRNSTFKAMPDVRLEVVGRMESHGVVVNNERMTASRVRTEDGIAIYQVERGCIVRMDVVLEPES